MADLGTVEISEETFGTVKKIAFAWTSENGGADDGKAQKTTGNGYSGEVIRLVTVPDGVDAPTDDYDVQILDEDNTDILMGAGANRDTANTEQVLASSLGCVANDKLTLSVANAGNAKKGTVYIYIR
jgi:hypothetical protein